MEGAEGIGGGGAGEWWEERLQTKKVHPSSDCLL